MTVTITIPGRIGGKGRARATIVGGFARLYTPKKTRDTEAMMRDFAAIAMRGLVPMEGPLAVEIRISQQPPSSWSKKKQAAAKWITGKPDCDNTIKLLDALNGIVWRDDSQIAKIDFERTYNLDRPEQAVIVVSTLDGG